MRIADKLLIVTVAVLCVVDLAGCSRMMTARHAQLVKDAEAKLAQGDFLRAINLYERTK